MTRSAVLLSPEPAEGGSNEGRLLEPPRSAQGESAGVTLAALPMPGARAAAAQQVKWSSGTEPPKLKAPANACDCHHHIYGSQYKVDPLTTLRAGDATVEDYRQLQKRTGTSRDVVVQP